MFVNSYEFHCKPIGQITSVGNVLYCIVNVPYYPSKMYKICIMHLYYLDAPLLSKVLDKEPQACITGFDRNCVRMKSRAVGRKFCLSHNAQQGL